VVCRGSPGEVRSLQVQAFQPLPCRTSAGPASRASGKLLPVGYASAQVRNACNGRQLRLVTRPVPPPVLDGVVQPALPCENPASSTFWASRWNGRASSSGCGSALTTPSLLIECLARSASWRMRQKAKGSTKPPLGLTDQDFPENMQYVAWSRFSAPLTTRCLIPPNQAAGSVWDKRPVSVAVFA
jgi:hypothetical protein